jgi:hypothetical protein
MKNFITFLCLAFLSLTAIGQNPDQTFQAPVYAMKGIYFADGTSLSSATTGSATVTWSSITGKPTFATVATSGLFSDLLSKPTTIAGYGITNAMTTSHASNGITSTLINNWNMAYSWGNPAGLYRPVSYVPSWTEITGKPDQVDLSTAISSLQFLLIPKLTTVQIAALSSPVAGTFVYDVTLNVLKIYNGTVWKTLITNQ